MPGFLAPGGDEFNLGPETRLDRSELLCNKVLLKSLKNRQRTLIDVFQRRYTDGQQKHRKMLNITNHQGNANQNHSEISLIPVRMAVIKKTINKSCW